MGGEQADEDWVLSSEKFRVGVLMVFSWREALLFAKAAMENACDDVFEWI